MRAEAGVTLGHRPVHLPQARVLTHAAVRVHLGRRQAAAEELGVDQVAGLGLQFVAEDRRPVEQVLRVGVADFLPHSRQVEKHGGRLLRALAGNQRTAPFVLYHDACPARGPAGCSG
jgi:hypothetical protein